MLIQKEEKWRWELTESDHIWWETKDKNCELQIANYKNILTKKNLKLMSLILKLITKHTQQSKHWPER